MKSKQGDLFEEKKPAAPAGGAAPFAPLAVPRGLMVGTCAFSHKDWRGTFYPPGLAARDEFAYYAQRLNAVEIDSSFYRVPTEAMVRRWLDAAPPNFMFALKAPKTLTHDARLDLDDETARKDWEALLALAPLLGDRLAAILLQFGTWIDARSAKRLERVLDSAPRTLPLAVEFRHRSWHTVEAGALLRERGAVRVWTDAYLDPRRKITADEPFTFEITGPFIYIRLLGDVSTKYDPVSGGHVHKYGAELFDRTDDLASWAERISRALAAGMPVNCYINNQYMGFSILTAQRLCEVLGGRGR